MIIGSTTLDFQEEETECGRHDAVVMLQYQEWEKGTDINDMQTPSAGAADYAPKHLKSQQQEHKQWYQTTTITSSRATKKFNSVKDNMPD